MVIVFTTCHYLAQLCASFFTSPYFFISSLPDVSMFNLVVVVLPNPFPGMGARGTPWRPNSHAMYHGMDQRTKTKVVPKLAWWKGSVAEHPEGGELCVFYPAPSEG